ncbi:MAG: hypothetical protein HOP19_10890, partial [Acidobacteria bacterium]|nr:hypothetical protein [Acidobacteriota bacterium]
TTGLIVTSAATSNGFTLNVGNGACGWNLTTSESWLSVTSPASGTARTVINFAATENTGATPRTAQIRVNNQQSISIQQAGRVAAVSAASYANTRVLAPNSIVSVFGEGMATGVAAASTIPLPTQLGNTQATITFTRNDQLVTVNCPLFFVSPGQINLLIPGTVTFGAARLIVRLNGSLYADQIVTIAVIAPGLFAANANGQGVPAAQLLRVKPGGVLVYEDVAVFEGGRFVPRVLDVGPDTDQLALILFGTGLRGVTAVDLVQIRIADQAPVTLFAGAQPDFTGLDQINLNLTAIRASLRGRGEVNLTGTIAGQPLNPLVLRFQ